MSCPTCGGNGEHYAGPPRAEVSHFTALAIWALHRMRQALERMDMTSRAHHASGLIRELEAAQEDTDPGSDA